MVKKQEDLVFLSEVLVKSRRFCWWFWVSLEELEGVILVEFGGLERLKRMVGFGWIWDVVELKWVKPGGSIRFRTGL